MEFIESSLTYHSTKWLNLSGIQNLYLIFLYMSVSLAMTSCLSEIQNGDDAKWLTLLRRSALFLLGGGYDALLWRSVLPTCGYSRELKGWTRGWRTLIRGLWAKLPPYWINLLDTFTACKGGVFQTDLNSRKGYVLFIYSARYFKNKFYFQITWIHCYYFFTFERIRSVMKVLRSV